MQPIWQQNYDPAGNIWLSVLVALIPIVFFFVALTWLRLKAGEAGVKHLLELFEKEMRVAMTLTSATRIADITGDLLVPNKP